MDKIEETRLCPACGKTKKEIYFEGTNSTECKWCVKKSQRTRLLKSGHLLKTERSSEEIFKIWDRLYHFEYLKIDPETPWVAKYPRVIYSTRFGTNEWITVPNKWDKTTRKALRMAKSYSGDVQFKLGAGARDLQRKWFFAVEVDADKVLVHEKNMLQFIDENVLRHFKRLNIQPELMFTGNRSIHAQWFFQKPLSSEQIQRFRPLASRIFKIRTDKDTEVNCLRIAGVMHSKSGQISRYPNNKELEDVLDHLESIQPVLVTDEIIERLRQEIEIKGPVVKKIFGDAALKKKRGENEQSNIDIVALTNSHKKATLNTDNILLTKDYPLHRYDGLDPIPPYKSHEALFATPLVFDTFRKHHGNLEDTRCELTQRLLAGARSEEVAQERLKKLENRMGVLPEYAPSGRPKLEYTSKDDARIKNALRRLRTLLRRDSDFKGINKVARYVYRQILDYGGEADLGVNQISRETGFRPSTVARWMRQLGGVEKKSIRLFHCEDEFSPPMADNRTRCWRIVGVKCLRTDQDRRWTPTERWIKTGKSTDALIHEIIARDGKPNVTLTNPNKIS